MKELCSGYADAGSHEPFVDIRLDVSDLRKLGCVKRVSSYSNAYVIDGKPVPELAKILKTHGLALEVCRSDHSSLGVVRRALKIVEDILGDRVDYVAKTEGGKETDS